MEIMGLQLPGSSFVNPDTEMRRALNKEGIRQLLENIRSNDSVLCLGEMLTEKTMVNGIVGLLATGGSTNLTLHLIAIAKAAGIKITWDDFSDLSDLVPLIARVYPNGPADVNHFHASGGMAFVISTLLKSGLLHEDVTTILGKGLEKYTFEPKLINGQVVYEEGPNDSGNAAIIRPATDPFSTSGGLKVLKGNLGTAVIKTSAVDPAFHVIEEDAIVFESQEDMMAAFKADELNKNFIAVLPFQGPRQKGMPELHNLTPSLTILQKRGYRVALVTDGRMSGASGKVPAAIHVSPEAALNGLIGKIKTGDRIRLNALTGELECLSRDLADRPDRSVEYNDQSHGRSLFSNLRNLLSDSESGAGFL